MGDVKGETELVGEGEGESESRENPSRILDAGRSTCSPFRVDINITLCLRHFESGIMASCVASKKGSSRDRRASFTTSISHSLICTYNVI